MNILGILNRLATVGALVAISSALVTAAHTQPEISAVKGSVTLNDQRASVGDLVGPGSVIKAGPGSYADIYLGVNGPTVQIMENTSVTIEELASDESGPEAVVNTKIKLTSGKISGYVKKTSSNSTYTVTTPTSTAAIRGTVYMISADGYVWVWDGCVDIVFTAPGGDSRNFVACAGQMFDPFLMKVVSNEMQTPFLIPPSDRPAVVPVGPVVNLSPVKPSGSSTGNNENGPATEVDLD